MVYSFMRSGIYLALCLIFLSGCTGAAAAETAPAPTQAMTEAPRLLTAPPSPTAVLATRSSLPVTGRTDRPALTKTPLPTPTPAPTRTATIAPEDWKKWPIMPAVSEQMREIYQSGLQQGNNPHAFSVLGDCQSQPEVFMGLFDSDPSAVQALPPNLQATVAQFAGSFDRYSPTVKDGTTEGALLWGEWNDNKEKKCEPGETPLECELRVHRPSIVFIHVGTHYEARNRRYLTLIVERLLEKGAVPVLVTKADNTELDERVNANIISLAAEYNLPLWNFWASVQYLPEGALEPGSNMYLNEEALVIHREDALKALDIVWRAVK